MHSFSLFVTLHCATPCHQSIADQSAAVHIDGMLHHEMALVLTPNFKNVVTLICL